MTQAFLHQADANQARASDPSASAWVSANAGTGKTEVLVKRTLRLLLGGARPESILCLTYTKTAAAEMQNRLLKVLGSWATLAEDALRDELRRLMERAPEDQDLRRARRLFAFALEVRGGLKIYTIHGFCERLLQRFPLEAAVTPHFTVLDEQEATLRKNAAFDAVVGRAAAERTSALGMALAKIIPLTSEDYFRQAVNAMLGKRAALARMTAYHDSLDDWAAREAEALKALLGVADRTEDAIIAEQAAILSDNQIDAALAAFAACASNAKTDREAEIALRSARRGQGGERAEAFRSVFLTQKGTAAANLCTRAMKDFAPNIAAMLDGVKTAFVALESDLAHLRVAEASGSVIVLADAILSEYEARKSAEAVLDYDDLIDKARLLLQRSGAAAWVLYKIDGGVDHILVDEAQDTNPDQWAIIEALAAEFFAGEGASEQRRTLFAVGDEKQSIYSFQGANPARFGEVGRAFRSRAAAARLDWREVPLNVSFRSTVPVLAAVDSVFAQAAAARGLTFVEGAPIKHYASRQGEAGLVELWEVETVEPPNPAPPFEPWNEEVKGARAVDELCRRIARRISEWTTKGEILESRGRPIKAGDILILVRRRDPFIAPMIRALKRHSIPVAGADRMRLMDQIAVEDLVALADVLLMPEDDLSLAVVLNSPLFGLDDHALFDLAHGRKGMPLWRVLNDKSGDPRFAEAATRLKAWLSRADLVPPYEFFFEVLGAEGQLMRKRMLTRLGPEAAEAIDEFLDAALAYDRDAAPSLQGFVDRLRGGEIDIKRDMDQDRDEVRIMTVHGAKGLQAPIVFLPDTCVNPRAQGPRIFALPRPGEPEDTVPHLLWPPAGHTNVAGVLSAKAAADEVELEEYHRLLYVAMTRACDRLYVGGWQGLRGRDEKCWYNLIEAGLGAVLQETETVDGITVRRLRSAQDKAPKAEAASEMAVEAAPLPDWALRPAPPERVRSRLAPSRRALGAGGEADADAEQPPLGPSALAENRRFARGRLVHALLQHLPQVAPAEQERAARVFVAARGAGLSEALREEIVGESLTIVRHADFAPLFQPGSLAEVPVVARIGDGEAAFEIGGQIDRLVVAGDDLLILDYKTNRPPPETEDEVAPAYIAQLAAYRLALAKLFPGKNLRAALLWTDGPHLMEISSTLLDAAMRDMAGRPASLDAIKGRT